MARFLEFRGKLFQLKKSENLNIQFQVIQEILFIKIQVCTFINNFINNFSVIKVNSMSSNLLKID